MVELLQHLLPAIAVWGLAAIGGVCFVVLLGYDRNGMHGFGKMSQGEYEEAERRRRPVRR